MFACLKNCMRVTTFWFFERLLKLEKAEFGSRWQEGIFLEASALIALRECDQHHSDLLTEKIEQKNRVIAC